MTDELAKLIEDEMAGCAKREHLVIRLMWAAVGVSIFLLVILVLSILKR